MITQTSSTTSSSSAHVAPVPPSPRCWHAPVDGCCSWTAPSSRATPCPPTSCSRTRCTCSTGSESVTGSALHAPAAPVRVQLARHGSRGDRCGFTPVGSHDRTVSIRRVALDAALVETAVEAGAYTRFGTSVSELVGSGTPDDPGARRRPRTGEQRARAVGSSGRRPQLDRRATAAPAAPPGRAERRDGHAVRLLGRAARLGLVPDRRPRPPGPDVAPCEDGVHLLSVAGPAT